ncbi:hypothetical protein HAX54_019163 [Datura stramonium]|uniref:Uncharacterized protein n=1 Tax=Datura stramonium TaxID=4076 RepID=A0ABS8Y6W9_DATST|nr:hypothetical protein [Datura stramonium]
MLQVWQDGSHDKRLSPPERITKKKLKETAGIGIKGFQKGHESYLGETSEESEGDGEGNLALMAKSDIYLDSDFSELEETVSVQKTENSKLKETVSSLKAESNTIKDKKASSSEINNNDQGLHEAEIVSLKNKLCKEKKKYSELQVSTPALNEGMLLEIDSLNVSLEPKHELENSGGTNSETMVNSEKGTGEGTPFDPVPKA